VLIENVSFTLYSRIMEIDRAVIAFSALAQATRLRTLQLLVDRNGDGVRATDIAVSLDVPPNTMSTHLAILNRAGLVKSIKNGREVMYSADAKTVHELLGFASDTILPPLPVTKRPSG
jgi:ArsR family transcriptional regulator